MPFHKTYAELKEPGKDAKGLNETDAEPTVEGDRCPSLAFSLHVNNLFNNMYYADAWVWRAYFQESDSWYSETGIFPQAPANFMFKVAFKF